MFASIDGPLRRKIFCEAYDDLGREVFVDLEAAREWQEPCVRLKCFPARRAIETVARAAVEHTFVPIDAAARYNAERLRAENPELQIETPTMPADFQILRPSGAGDPPAEWAQVRRLGRLRLGVYGMAWDPEEDRVTLRGLSEIIDVQPYPGREAAP